MFGGGEKESSNGLFSSGGGDDEPSALNKVSPCLPLFPPLSPLSSSFPSLSSGISSAHDTFLTFHPPPQRTWLTLTRVTLATTTIVLVPGAIGV